MTAKTLQRTLYRLALVCMVAIVPSVSLGTDLADSPLANSTTKQVPPNVAVVIDDSWTMRYDYMPETVGSNSSRYCFKWHGYNTLAYNPSVTYPAPIKADGESRLPDSSFTAAPNDGYFLVDGSTQEYDNSTTNATTNLTSLGTVQLTQSTYTKSTDFKNQLQVKSVKVTLLDGTEKELLSTTPVPGSKTANVDAVLQAVANSINANTVTTGFTATYDSQNNTLTIVAPESQADLNTTPVVTDTSNNDSIDTTRFTTTLLSGFYYVNQVASPSTEVCDSSNYVPVTSKNDIAAPDVANGSAEALTNYANWYSYYRKRNFMVKAGLGEAFATLANDKYRVGYFTIDSKESGSKQSGSSKNSDLKIANFSGSQREDWYKSLYGTRQVLATPLRGALSRMGRMYAGKIDGWDPVQYYCQRNYTLLATDGYWNMFDESTTYGPYQLDNQTKVGDQDGVAGTTRPELDALQKPNSLADVAYYYYYTDLRTPDLNNCTNAFTGADGTVCTNFDPPEDGKVPAEGDKAWYQHMTTFTIGLGVSGGLTYRSDYLTANGDSDAYYRIKNGSLDWPDPHTSDTSVDKDMPERIDDLWHAAVNGHGMYLSAGNAQSLASNLIKAFNSIDATEGAGAGAATGSLEPTKTGLDNKVYVATYETVDWWGDIKAYSFDLGTGATNSTEDWKASTYLDARIGDAGNSDTRTIYVDVGGARKSFAYDNLSGTQKAYFDNSQLSQYANWSDTDKTAGTAAHLIEYLRGQSQYENEDDATARLYRARTHVMGDIVHSQPVYIKNSPRTYDASFDPTYDSRMGILYTAANDGMVHAFCVETAGDCTPGKELWAFVIPTALKSMWYLADEKFSAAHRYYLDGPLTVGDVYFGSAWHTILVGGLGKGGRGYYALDVTDPTDPSLLWTFTADDNENMGYSYGAAMVAKVASSDVGTNADWRVLVASGYNNIPDTPNTGDYKNSDGGGYIFVLDAATGTLKDTWATGSGNTDSPSGLAHIQVLAPDLDKDGTLLQAYGGDLNGDMWRFDPDGTATKVIGMGSTSPITTRPELGQIDGENVLYFGTGRYLGTTDLETSDQQYIVAVKASASSLTISDLDEASSSFDWGSGYGWYIALTGAKERIDVSPQLFLGTLTFTSKMPEASECKPNGSSRLYHIDYETGTGVNGNSLYVTFPDTTLVGFSSIMLPGGTLKTIAVTDQGKTETTTTPVKPSGLSSESGSRVMWRELID